MTRRYRSGRRRKKGGTFLFPGMTTTYMMKKMRDKRKGKGLFGTTWRPFGASRSLFGMYKNIKKSLGKGRGYKGQRFIL